MATKKEETIARAEGLGIDLAGNETQADLDALIAAKEAEQVPTLTRRRVNRGSRRRIERAHAKFKDELKAYMAEMDLQGFIADEDGKRVGTWPFVEGLKKFDKEIDEHVNALLQG